MLRSTPAKPDDLSPTAISINLIERLPVKSGLTIALAPRALAIKILLTLPPLRLHDLINLRLGISLQCDDPRTGRITRLWVPADETKNGRMISVPIPSGLADMLALWIKTFRPRRAGAGNPFLFPGGSGDGPITPQGMRDAVKAITHEVIGLKVSPHKFRHFNACDYLRRHPGHYHLVGKFLNHADGSSPTIKKTRKGYGRWLAYLASTGELDPDQPPADRVTLPALGRYFDALLEAGNAPFTVYGRFSDLHRALRIMAPGRDVGFIMRPNGVRIRALLRMRRRSFPIPDVRVLVAWGGDLIADAANASSPLQRALAQRDGLLISMLASRARRLRAMAGLRVGHEIVREGDRYRIDLPPRLVKMKRRDRFLLPATLTPAIDAYLAEARPLLAGGSNHDAFWVTKEGRPLTERGLTHIVERHSHRRFGITFRTHRFRHAIGTTLPMHLSNHPGLAAAVIDNSPDVMDEHYDRASQAQAMEAFLALRTESEALATEDVERRRRLRAARAAKSTETHS